MKLDTTIATLTFGLLWLTAPSFAMGSGPSGPAGTVPVVTVSIMPQAYFVDRISGGRVRVLVLVGQGKDPHSYDPTPRQMAELSSSPLWLLVGADFERALRPKVAALYPKMAIVDTTGGIAYRKLEAHAHAGEKSDAAHGGGGLDIHVWLGRQAAKTMAANIRDALSTRDPAGASIYSANHDELVADIDAAWSTLARDLAPLRGKTVFVYHPSFGYLLDDFGIVQEAVETGGKEPTQKNLAALIDTARTDGARIIFVQPQFPASAAKTVADAIGGIVVEIDALAPDWLENIRRIGAALKKAAK